jgi:galactokinase
MSPSPPEASTGRSQPPAPQSPALPSPAQLRASFAARFGSAAGLRSFFAPGRVNLMGAHLDYNGGPVMPTAIDRGTWILVRPRPDRRVVLASELEEARGEFEMGRLPPAATGTWVDYPLGVIRALAESHPDLPGLELLFGGNLPVGAGLSSSASICVGTAHALGHGLGLGLDADREVELALSSERGFVGVQCGIMDPFAVAHSRPDHLLWLDCKDRSIDHVPLDAARYRVGVADSGVRRELARGDFNRRVDECREAFARLAASSPGATCLRDVSPEVVEAERARLPGTLLSRARHVTAEVQRTFDARDALRAGRVAEFGRCMAQTHDSLRDLFEVSTPELDCLVAAAMEVDGVLGSRLTGAGFGGCTVILLEVGAEQELARHLETRFQRDFDRSPRVDFYRGDPGPRELDPAR